MSSAPVTIWIQYDEIDSLSSSAFWMPPSSSSARMTPRDRAAAAEDRDAAEQHRGDGGELEALADVGGAPSSCAA